MRELSVRQLYKDYPSTKTQALCGISCSFQSGEIHVLAGENGAGKSTLARILSGVERPSSGSIIIDDHEKVFHTKHEAEKEGIAFVPQFPAVADGLAVYEQLMLGREFRSLGFFIDRKKNLTIAKTLIDTYGFSVDPRKLIRDCTAAEIREVEILQALYRDVDCIILDEPTTVLDRNECSKLFSILQKLKASGKIVIYISHRVPEIMELADRITILESGKLLKTLSRGEINAQSLSIYIAGNSNVDTLNVHDLPSREPAVLEFRNVSGFGNGADVLQDIKLVLSKGDFTAVLGAEGNGLEMMENLAVGISEPAEGCVLLHGKPIGELSAHHVYRKALCYIPAKREHRGLCLRESVLYNTAGKVVPQIPVHSFIRTLTIKALSVLTKFDITSKVQSPVESLSGGNRQRLMVGRELENGGEILLLCNPFQGLDGKSRQKIREAIIRKTVEHTCVLLLTSDIDDLFDLPLTQIHVLYRGKLYPYSSAEASGSMAAMLTGAGNA